MTKAELVNSIAIHTGYDRVTIMNIVETAMAEVKKNEKVEAGKPTEAKKDAKSATAQAPEKADHMPRRYIRGVCRAFRRKKHRELCVSKLQKTDGHRVSKKPGRYR